MPYALCLLNSGYCLLTTLNLSKRNVKALHFAANRIMEEFELQQCLETMAVLTHKIRGIYSEKTVSRIPFKIYALTFSSPVRVPLVNIMAGCTGDIARNCRIT